MPAFTEGADANAEAVGGTDSAAKKKVILARIPISIYTGTGLSISDVSNLTCRMASCPRCEPQNSPARSSSTKVCI